MLRELILYRQVEGLNVRGLKVILAAIKIQALPAVDCRVFQVDRCKGSFQSSRFAVGQHQGMLGVRAIKGGGVDKRIVCPQRPAVAEISQGAKCDSVSAADHKRWHDPLCKTQSGCEV